MTEILKKKTQGDDRKDAPILAKTQGDDRKDAPILAKTQGDDRKDAPILAKIFLKEVLDRGVKMIYSSHISVRKAS